MDVNGIDTQGPLRSHPDKKALKNAGHPPPQGKPKRSADRIELSDQAKALLKDAAVEGVSREEIIEAARQRLDSGELVTPEALENAAKKLLDSGDLEGADAE